MIELYSHQTASQPSASRTKSLPQDQLPLSPPTTIPQSSKPKTKPKKKKTSATQPPLTSSPPLTASTQPQSSITEAKNSAFPPLPFTTQKDKTQKSPAPTISSDTNSVDHPSTSPSSNLSPIFHQYLRDYQLDHIYRQQRREQSLEVDNISLAVGEAYEKVRKVIDWKEDNALRRGAIYRALKRSLLPQIYGFSNQTPEVSTEFSEKILLELMRTGYFENDLLGQDEANNFQAILNKYCLLISQNGATPKSLQNDSLSSTDDQPSKKPKTKQEKKDLKNRIKFQTWLLELAACEIENCLAPDLKNEALVNFMKNIMTERLRIVAHQPLTTLDEEIQIELAVRRSLNQDDHASLTFHVIKLRYPFWLQNSPQTLNQITAQIQPIHQQVEQDLATKIGNKFKVITDRYDASYRLIGDIRNDQDKTRQTPDQVIKTWSDPEQFTTQLRQAYDTRRQSLKARLLRSSIWSTLSILLANGLSIVVLEGPIAKLMGYDFSWLSIVADLLIPSLLMFALVISIKPPPESNYSLVETEVKNLIYQSDQTDTYQIKLRNKPLKKPIRYFFNTMYALCALVALAFLYWLLALFGLPPTSIYLNIVYIAMVFFTGFNIKEKSQEITIQEKGNLFEFLLELFSVPLAKIGRWFSKKWKEYNIVAIFFSVLIDTPFSAFITLIGDWRNYLKERVSEL